MAIKDGEILDLNLDDLFKEEPVAGTPPVTEEKNLELTEAMTKRINEVKAKTEATVRDEVAKNLGFENYAAMQKAKDKKEITEAGYNPEDLEKLIEPMLEKRLAADPRMQKLQQLEEQEQKAVITAELAKIETMTGQKVTEADLSKETLDLMGKGVPLAQAYIATNSTKIIASANRGTTTHMASGAGAGQTKFRNLSQSEKDLYKSINSRITDEELNKKTIEVKQTS